MIDSRFVQSILLYLLIRVEGLIRGYLLLVALQFVLYKILIIEERTTNQQIDGTYITLP